MKKAESINQEKGLKMGENLFSKGLFKAEQLLIYAGVLAGVFLLGLFAGWISGREVRSERDAVKQELRLSQLQNQLGFSMVSARGGEYERARTSASDFFSDLRAEMDRAGEEDAAFNGSQRQAVEPILAQRDDIITLLARSDPASVDRLADLYAAYVEMKNPDGSR